MTMTRTSTSIFGLSSTYIPSFFRRPFIFPLDPLLFFQLLLLLSQIFNNILRLPTVTHRPLQIRAENISYTVTGAFRQCQDLISGIKNGVAAGQEPVGELGFGGCYVLVADCVSMKKVGCSIWLLLVPTSAKQRYYNILT
ncbi:hypothetical protein BDQ12DRAFT_690941 [Crucibulum laeve]|uniref:Uncharacterized protein n=1 Tax=Crucibulum laeve TaxID=68775 RepID=A0A5C3LLL4_9AGAR|nr:hypothetical protein BDQ12DRAFT_690941 [Crucibulum laeve]